MNEPMTIIFSIVVNFALMICFLRFMFQLADIEKKHPYAKALYTISAVVTVFGRIFPDMAKGRLSLSAVVLMVLLCLIKMAGLASILGKSLTALGLFLGGTLTGLLAFVNMLQYIILASVIVSWIVLFSQKMHPVMDIIMQLAEPIIAPFRKIVPNLGMIDLSTLAAFLALALLEKVIQVVGGHLFGLLG